VRLSLNPSIDPADYRFVHRIRTRFAETDAMGIIHHGAYVPYLEAARVELLRHVGHAYDEVRKAGINFAVLELFVRYRRPLYFDDAVDVHVTAANLTRTTFEVGYLLQVEGQTRATAVTVHGAVDHQGRPARMPSWLTSVMGGDPTER
jgi:acyl-CoA thioester hydrolase